MVKEMSQNITARMVCHNVIDAAKAPVYAYGFELLLSSLVGTFALLVISLVLCVPLWWIPYLLGFVPFRLLGGGYHAKTHRSCIVAFSFLYALSVTVEKIYVIPSVFHLLSCVLNIIIMYLFAPVAPPNKPLSSNRKTVNRRICLLLGCLNLGLEIIQNPSNEGNQWLIMYFAGSCMAGFSMLLAVVNKNRRR